MSPALSKITPIADAQVFGTFSTHQVTEVSQERAYEIAAMLRNKTEFENDAMKVFRGDHEEYGTIYVAICPIGNSLILPIVSHQ